MERGLFEGLNADPVCVHKAPKPGAVFCDPVSGGQLVVHSYVVDEATLQIRVSLTQPSDEEGSFLGCTVDDWEKRKEELLQQNHGPPEDTCEMPKKDSLWRHYKGGKYMVRGIERDMVDSTVRVIYYDTTGKYNFCWARKIESWNNPENGQKRFTLVG